MVSPKLYFTEPGLVAYLLEIRTPEQAARDPLLGGLFENLVVTEALKTRWNQGGDADLYYFRDSGGFEVDLILSRQRQLFPVEIKAARSFHPDFARNLKKFSSWSDSIQDGAVIYAGEQQQSVHAINLLPFDQTSTWFGE